MHRYKLMPAAASAAALAVPLGNLTAASAATSRVVKKKVVTVSRKVSGSEAQVDRWGYLNLTLIVRKTTTTNGSRKAVTRRITGVTVPEYPNHTDRSVFINQQALPLLIQEVLHAQMNPNIQLISGATDTSYAFAESLQSAILKAKKV